MRNSERLASDRLEEKSLGKEEYIVSFLAEAISAAPPALAGPNANHLHLVTDSFTLIFFCFCAVLFYSPFECK